MKIGILSKREKTFTGRMKQYLESLGHSVTVFTAKNLIINKSLLDHDFFVLKSKKLIYLYAGRFIKENDVPIFPDPDLTYQHKHRLEAHYLLKQAGLLTPTFFLGTKEAIKNNLKDEFPLVSKSLMDSGSKDVKFINSDDDLSSLNDEVIYYEKKIKGIHYIIYFINEEISVSEKPPLSTEHVKMKQVVPTDEMVNVINQWKKCHDIPFGHLDVIKEESTGKIYVVDPGTFPEFTNWKQGDDPCPKICNIILNQVERLKKNMQEP